MPATLPPNFDHAPPEALCFTAQLEVGAGAAAEGKAKPVTILARTGQAVDHWYFGRVVHDMAGMTVEAPRIPIDYCHNWDEVLGYSDEQTAANDGLTVKGQIIPFTDDDRASEVLYRAGAGIPYQASITFADDYTYEVIGEGQQAAVNGYQFAGPGVIIRQWKLRGVAICPYGVDGDARSMFAARRGGAPFTFSEEATMPSGTAAPAPAAPVTAAPPATATAGTPASATAGTPASATADPKEKPSGETPAAVATAATAGTPANPIAGSPADPNATAPPPAAHAATDVPAPVAAAVAAPATNEFAVQGKRFLDAFGPQGGMYFAEGLSFEAAQTKFAAANKERLSILEAENAQLRTQLTALRGEPQPVSFQAEPRPEDTRVNEFAAKGVGDNIAKFAAGIKLPGAR